MEPRDQIHRRSYENLKTIFGLATILWQLANSQNIYDNRKTYLKTTSYDRLLDVLRQLGPIRIPR